MASLLNPLAKVGLGMGAVIMLHSSVDAAAMTHSTTAPPASTLQRIEQPLGVKVGVTLGGLAVMGLELWWFLGSKTKPHIAQSRQEP
jgi:plastocyanin domain-containing protein